MILNLKNLEFYYFINFKLKFLNFRSIMATRNKDINQINLSAQTLENKQPKVKFLVQKTDSNFLTGKEKKINLK